MNSSSFLKLRDWQTRKVFGPQGEPVIDAFKLRDWETRKVFGPQGKPVEDALKLCDWKPRGTIK